MIKSIRRIFALTVAGLWLASTALAEVPAQYVEHDFLTDYSLLEAYNDGVADFAYISPTAFTDLADYNALMVDQPEIFISPNSSYKGVKPDNLTAIAEIMRSALTARMEEAGYNIVEAAGPGVLFLRIALADLELVKKKRAISGYTPVGFVAHAAKDANKEELAKKMRLDYVTVEVELVDSVSGEVHLAGLLSRGVDEKTKSGKEKTEIIQWEAFDAYLQNLGKRIECRISNAKLPENEWADCLAIKAELIQEEQKRKLF